MRVRIDDARFLVSAADERAWPGGEMPEVAFAGRSNVGKSSLINCLLGRRALARVSSTPGRTRTLNFLDVSFPESMPIRCMRMVDLPGYGYAKVSKQERRRWGPMVESYVIRREDLKMVLLVVDARRPPTDLDLSMAGWLKEVGRPWLCVVTKIDKLPRSKRLGAVNVAARTLGIEQGRAVGFSAEEGTARDEVWSQVMAAATYSG